MLIVIFHFFLLQLWIKKLSIKLIIIINVCLLSFDSYSFLIFLLFVQFSKNYSIMKANNIWCNIVINNKMILLLKLFLLLNSFFNCYLEVYIYKYSFSFIFWLYRNYETMNNIQPSETIPDSKPLSIKYWIFN